LKEIGAILVAITTMTLAMISFFREEKETTAKFTYKELAAQAEKASIERLQIQKDISNIRGYLEATKNHQENIEKKLTDIIKTPIIETPVIITTPNVPEIPSEETPWRTNASPRSTAKPNLNRPPPLPELMAAPEEYSAPSID
jgi:ATP-dependent Zn protease